MRTSVTTSSSDGNEEKSSARFTFVDMMRIRTAVEMLATINRSSRAAGNGTIITLITSTITAGKPAWARREVFIVEGLCRGSEAGPG